MQTLPAALLNNMQVEDIAQSIIVNNFTSYSDRLRTQLNKVAREDQSIQLEEKYLQLTTRFQAAPDSVRACILHDIDYGIQRIEQQESNLAFIQDPASLKRGRKHRKGEKRIPTGAEITAKKLRQNEKYARKEARERRETDSANIQPNQLFTTIKPVVANHIPTLSQRAPVIMTFTSSGSVVRSSQRPQHVAHRSAQCRIPTATHDTFARGRSEPRADPSDRTPALARCSMPPASQPTL